MCDKTDLKALVQTTNQTLGFIPRTPSDFNELCYDIKRKTGYSISLSSLKRLWGYVEYKSSPSPNTLNILARYNDFNDWEDFMNNHDLSDQTETSGFIDGSVVDSESLDTGDILLLRWENNKTCELEYLGEHRYHVLSSCNIKLLADDILTIHSMCVGLPFFAADILRGESVIPGYVGAKNTGIGSIQFHTS